MIGMQLWPNIVCFGCMLSIRPMFRHIIWLGYLGLLQEKKLALLYVSDEYKYVSNLFI